MNLLQHQQPQDMTAHLHPQPRPQRLRQLMWPRREGEDGKNKHDLEPRFSTFF